MKNINIIGFFFILIIIILFVAPFVYTFKSSCLSNKISDWGNFGGYFSLLASVISLMIISYLTLSINNYQRNIDKPIIIFKVKKMDRIWFIRNVGRGVALNILIADKDELGVTLGVKCYSLGPTEELVIDWRRKSSEWIAVYQDYFGKEYSSICHNDEIAICEGNKIAEKFGNISYERLDETSTIV